MRTIQEIFDSGIIVSKDENYLLYEGGYFGNKPLTWNSLAEIKKSGWEGKICIRSK